MNKFISKAVLAYIIKFSTLLENVSLSFSFTVHSIFRVFNKKFVFQLFSINQVAYPLILFFFQFNCIFSFAGSICKIDLFICARETVNLYRPLESYELLSTKSINNCAISLPGNLHLSVII